MRTGAKTLAQGIYSKMAKSLQKIISSAVVTGLAVMVTGCGAPKPRMGQSQGLDWKTLPIFAIIRTVYRKQTTDNPLKDKGKTESELAREGAQPSGRDVHVPAPLWGRVWR